MVFLHSRAAAASGQITRAQAETGGGGIGGVILRVCGTISRKSTYIKVMQRRCVLT